MSSSDVRFGVVLDSWRSSSTEFDMLTLRICPAGSELVDFVGFTNCQRFQNPLNTYS